MIAQIATKSGGEVQFCYNFAAAHCKQMPQRIGRLIWACPDVDRHSQGTSHHRDQQNLNKDASRGQGFGTCPRRANLSARQGFVRAPKDLSKCIGFIHAEAITGVYGKPMAGMRRFEFERHGLVHITLTMLA